MYISIISVFTSLIPACVSDFKTRQVDPKIWRPAAFIGIPIGISAFCIKLMYNEIIIPSLILTLTSVMIVIIFTIIMANIKDPFYNPKICEQCNSTLTTKADVDKCPKCNYMNAKAILGGADMIAIDIILITSFYLSPMFIMTFILSFVVASAVTLFISSVKVKDKLNYRIPLIIPITIGYAMTLIFITFSIDIVKYI